MQRDSTISKRLQWFAELNEKANLEERFLSVIDACKTLSSYRDFYNCLRKNQQQLLNDGIRAGNSLRERTAEAERSLRIIMKECLDILNGWRDCRLLGEVVGQTATSPLTVMERVEPALLKAKSALKQRYPKADFSFIDEVSSLLKPYNLQVTYEEGALRVKASLGHDVIREFLIQDRPQPGFLGTIHSQQFFSPTTSGMVAFRPPISSVATGDNSEKIDVVDAYSALIGGANFAKCQMYRHFRQVEAQGMTTYAGNEGAAVIIAWVIAIACFIAGTIINIGCAAEWWTDDDLCDWVGWLIMLLGLLVAGLIAVGGGEYALVIGTAAAAPIDP